MQIWWFHDFSKILKHHFAIDSSGGTGNPWPSSCEKDILKKVCVSFDGFHKKLGRFRLRALSGTDILCKILTQGKYIDKVKDIANIANIGMILINIQVHPGCEDDR